MKYIILVILLLIRIQGIGQDNSTLQIIRHNRFYYDTLFLIGSAGTIVAENLKSIGGNKTISTYTLKKNPDETTIFRLCFGKKDENTWNTLILTGKGANIKIEVQNSFKIGSN